ncbi:MAG: hypothetical protein AAF573_23065, partial [Bacteroidota bacterium]
IFYKRSRSSRPFKALQSNKACEADTVCRKVPIAIPLEVRSTDPVYLNSQIPTNKNTFPKAPKNFVQP